MRMEIRNAPARSPVSAVLFDFDGTISTLRYGWEDVMRPMMLEMISGGSGVDAQLERLVDDYISESTGIQTIQQMKWLAETVRKYGKNPSAPSDPWWYKDVYNRRLIKIVNDRLQSIRDGIVPRERYMIEGSEDFLRVLVERGIQIFVASGTDHPDVLREVEALGLTKYFTAIAGAPVGREDCSKKKVIAQLLDSGALQGQSLAVVGDGKVEIQLGHEADARTLGLASDEGVRHGINPVKRARLIRAGADCICGDFTEREIILEFLGL